MFSIINTGLANVLVWFSPGSRAISTLAPLSARPVSDPHAIPEPSLLPPLPRRCETSAALHQAASGSSQTPAFSDARESSHTQEFTTA
jgi:hypothetical protein